MSHRCATRVRNVSKSWSKNFQFQFKIVTNFTVGDPCTSEGEPCPGLDHSVCRKALCHCQFGYYEKNRVCMPELGEIARDASFCPFKGRFENNRCLCPYNNFYAPNMRFCLKRKSIYFWIYFHLRLLNLKLFSSYHRIRGLMRLQRAMFGLWYSLLSKNNTQNLWMPCICHL